MLVVYFSNQKVFTLDFFSNSPFQLTATYVSEVQVVNCSSGRKGASPESICLSSLPLALPAHQKYVFLRAVQAALPAPSHLCAESHQVRGALPDGVRGALQQRLREAMPHAVHGGLPSALCHSVHHVLHHPVCGALCRPVRGALHHAVCGGLSPHVY